MTYQAQTGCEDDNLILLSHPNHELIDTWSLDDVHLMDRVLNLDGDDEISIVYRL